MPKNKTVDDYIKAHAEWQDELQLLHELIQATGMQETIKWGAPVYTVDGKNVVGLGAFKSYVGIWFFQGVFLKDKQKKLVNAQEGTTKALRQWRFNSLDEIDAKLVTAYVKEAIANQQAGKEVKPERKTGVDIPPELKQALSGNAKLKQAFGKVTPGKQREFADYIASAKRDATKQIRLEKITPMILAGAGLYDKYKDC